MRIGWIALLSIALLAALAEPPAASAQSVCIMGEVKWFAGNFEPKNWRIANGQLLSVAQNQALFAILGNQFGGTFPQNFALPDLRGRIVIGTGQGPSLTNRSLGERGGAEAITLAPNQMPLHSHGVMASADPPIASDPGGNVWAENPRSKLYDVPGLTVDMSPSAVSVVGGGQPHPNVMPYQALNPIICTEGVFPSQQ